MNKNSLTVRQQFSVSFAYPVSFTHGLFDVANPLLAETAREGFAGQSAKVLVYVDDGVAAAHPQLLLRISHYLRHYSDVFAPASEPIILPGGERAKNGWNVVRNMMTDMGNAHLDRHSFVIAVGGGSMLDSVGFAASIVHRGIRLIRVPTTVLAQNDAGVGVKTGMDEHGIKNFVGTFAPPFAVLCDFDFLATLSDKYWSGGIAEAFKVAIIKDAAFFDFLEENAGNLYARDAAAMEELVVRTARLHLDHIRESGDPFESGSARPLDFGHWAAHKLEVMSNYRLGHGQAVAVGIALDSRYAALQGLLENDESDRIQAALLAAGLPVWDRLLEARDDAGNLQVLKGLDEFREHLGGQLTITLPNALGRRIEVHRMNTASIQCAIEHIKKSLVSKELQNDCQSRI